MEEINYGDFAQERVVDTNAQNGDDWQYSLRPKHLREYIGQKKVKDNLDISVDTQIPHPHGHGAPVINNMNDWTISE